MTRRTGATRLRLGRRVHHGGVSPTARERRPTVAHGLAALTAALTLLALLGKAVACDCQAVRAVLEVWRHLRHVGF